MQFTSITIQGNILSREILEKITREDIDHQDPGSFGFEKKDRVRDEVGLAWASVKDYWHIFNRRRERLKETDTGTTETRNLWMIPFLTELGYTVEKSSAEVLEGKTYAVSHRAVKRDGFPVHIVGCQQKLDSKDALTQTRLSSHALVQEYLNRNEEHLYALVTNGQRVRLLRNANRLSKLAYLEFDLEKIFEEELFSEFALLFRLLHVTRMPQKRGEGEASIIEFYHQESIATGDRIREKLRFAVKESLKQLGNGLIRHPANSDFAEAVGSGAVSPQEYYNKLLRTIYRMLFLIVIEERNLVFPQDVEDKKEVDRFRKLYEQFYSIERLRGLASRKLFVEGEKSDIWEGLKATFRLFEPVGKGQMMGIQPLGGNLFYTNGLEVGEDWNLYDLKLNNRTLLEVIANLTITETEEGQRTRVNYNDLDVEELGSIYEGLLELHPVFYPNGNKSVFGFTEGSERKTTGSYYTRHDLVQQLIKTSLIPVIEERLDKASDRQAKEEVLLGIRVCDPAAGSGHFLLAAARELAFALAVVRSGEENPGDDWVLPARRDVIRNCIYGVDKNPPAVELCRLSLWLESHNSGKPLSFLEHKIRCGDSLVGIDRMDWISELIPEGAFKPVSGDEKRIASGYKKQNKLYLDKWQANLFQQNQQLTEDHEQLAEQAEELNRQAEESIQAIQKKEETYESIRSGRTWMREWTAANLYTHAFFQRYTEEEHRSGLITSETLDMFLRSKGSYNARLEGKANAAALHNGYFHWPLEFPEVFQQGGFDVMLANPPWERIKLQEKEFFATRSDAIANAPNKAARERIIKKLSQIEPELYEDYQSALQKAEASSRFIRGSGRFELTSGGDINTYSIFAELIKNSTNDQGRAGFIVPTGIATDNTNRHYFASLIEEHRLVSLYDFENRKKIFPSVDSRYKFSLLALGQPDPARKPQFGFFLHDVLDLQDHRRVFELSKQDFLNINPNTKTTPIFRTRQDAELTAKIYSRVPVLINEEKNQNQWGIKFSTMFHMSNDSHLFKTRDELEGRGFQLMGNRFIRGEEIWLPLYESKMIWHYDHRLGSYEGVTSRSSTHIKRPTKEEYQDPCYQILPWYWVRKDDVDQLTDRKWFLGFRDITNSTNERTVISSFTGLVAIGHTQPLIIIENSLESLFLNAILSTITFDYIARQKVGGTHLTYNYLRQLPVLRSAHINKVYALAFEMIYTSWDIKAVADDVWREADDGLRHAIQKQWDENKLETGGYEWMPPNWKDAYPEIDWDPEQNGGCPFPPFKWDNNRRVLIRAELDASFALLYGLERDELRYILDPQEVYGEEFPGETFRVLKEKEIRNFGEFRTKKLVLEAWDRLVEGKTVLTDS
ncbi:hypothetical protein QLX67_01840 [Balneolaceae bacterium ANBcel3]|nr:hypothetical protein [Balneolaceae bacterium ANBcel3]